MATPKRTKHVAGAMARSDAGTAELLAAIRHIWESARLQAARSVNSALVQANWLIGRQIVEAEQKGKSRAAYSSRLLKTLSENLEKDYGNGFSVSALQYMRAFYLGYPALLGIQHAAGVESEKQHAVRVESAPEADWQPGRLHAGLSWTHYRTLLKVGRREARDFYEIEAIRNGWSARQLERQINTLLIDLKVEKLTHGDLGQMQMYVNYYDREIAGPEDQPTIGLILCADKNEAMVRYVLDDKAKHIFASRYQFQLPSEDVLRAEIKREIEELDSGNAQS